MRIDAVIQDQLPFPVRVEVLPGELFRSLVVRLAHVHGEKIQSFGFRLVGKGRTLFGDDLDRGQWAGLLKTIECRARLSGAQILGTTLRSYEGVLYEKMAAFGPARWVLPVSQASTYRRWFGLQYCAVCLAEDAEPYFRLAWRLAFYIWCERHSVLVHDRCPQCGSPVTVHRLDVGGRTSDLRSPLLWCPVCGHDRRGATESVAGPSDREAISLQVRMLAALHDGVGHVGQDAVHSLPYFTGMAILWSLLDDTTCSATLWSNEFEDAEGGSADKARRTRLGGVEALAVRERRRLLQACATLLRDGVQGLLEALQRAGLSSDKVLRYSGRDRSQPPYWLWRPVRIALDRTMYVPSQEEIGTAIDQGLRTSESGFLRIRDVCAALGMRTNHSARVAAAMHRRHVVQVRRRAR